MVLIVDLSGLCCDGILFCFCVVFVCVGACFLLGSESFICLIFSEGVSDFLMLLVPLDNMGAVFFAGFDACDCCVRLRISSVVFAFVNSVVGLVRCFSCVRVIRGC